MDRNLRSIALKIIAVTGIFCFLYPLLLMLRMLIFTENGGGWAGLYNYCLALGGFICSLLLIGHGKGKIPVLKAGLTVLIPMVLSIVLYRASGSGREAYEVLIGILMYFTGFRAFYVPPASLLSGKKVWLGAGILFACLIVSFYFRQLAAARPYVLFFTYGFLGMVLLVSNQTGIDEAFIKRHIDRANIPGNMRKYNTSLVVWLYAVIVILINVKAIVNAIAVFLHWLVIQIVNCAAWLFLLLSRLFKQSESGAPSGGQNPLPDMGANTQKGILPVILTILIGLLAAYLLYVLGKRLPSALRALRDKLKELFDRVAGYLGNLLKVYGDGAEEIDDYEDDVQTVKVGDALQEKQLKRQLGRIRRGLRGITDPVQKVRYIYGMLLQELKERDIDVRKSDTAGEVLRKVKSVQGAEQPFAGITTIYEEVKYGGEIPEAVKVESVEAEFKKMEEVLKRRKK